MNETRVNVPRADLHDLAAWTAFRRRERLDPDRLRRMRYALYRSYEPVESALRRLGTAADLARRDFELQPLRVVEQHASSLDQSSKFVLSTGDDERLETVVLRAPSGRAAVCVSTQVGCRAGCAFCATARMGLRRSLTAGEILEQVLLAARHLQHDGQRLRNIVFMGMGEPLDNETELYRALDWLQDEEGFHLPARRLAVSTVGIPSAMVRLVDRFPGVQLALSLHSARPEIRQRLIPWARQYDLASIRSALAHVVGVPKGHRQQGPVMIEYIMIAGVNDADEDAWALRDFLGEMPVHVNLIPYNSVPGVDRWQPTPRTRRDDFAAILRSAGLFTTIRYSLGADIGAACGQLAQKTKFSQRVDETSNASC